MFRFRMALTLAPAAAACLPMAAQAQADKATVNATEGDFDFVDANAGNILPGAKRPKDKTILVYCNTSSFAAQVALASGRRVAAWKPTRGRARRAEA